MTQENTKLKRRPLPAKTRLAQALRTSRQIDPLLPIVLHTTERGLRREASEGKEQPVSIFDRVYDRVLSRHRNVRRRQLENFIRDYRSLPDEVVARVVPANLMKLDVTQPLRVSEINDDMFERVVFDSKLYRNVFNELGEINEEPYITKVSPDKASYEPGEKVKLTGANLNTQKAKITVRIIYPAGDFTESWMLVIPPSTSPGSVSFILPDDVKPGRTYTVYVIRDVDGKVYTSNVKYLHIIDPAPTPEVPQPTITDITPQQRRPGDKIIITGTNFLNADNSSGILIGDCSHVWIEPMDIDGQTPFGKVLVKSLNSTQLEVMLPIDLVPGLYRFKITNSGDSNGNFSGQKSSNWLIYDVLPHQFRVNFLTMRCLDKSDPETVLPTGNVVHDELVTTWAVAADALRIGKLSSEYTGFDDGDVGAYNAADSNVFSGEVKHGLVIGTQLLEWDAGDVQAANEVVKFFGDLAAEMAKLLADKAPKAAAILAGVAALAPFLQKIIAYFGGEADLLGDQPIGFNARDLQNKTQNANKKFGGELAYLNNDDTGSYTLAYEIARLT